MWVAEYHTLGGGVEVVAPHHQYFFWGFLAPGPAPTRDWWWAELVTHAYGVWPVFIVQFVWWLTVMAGAVSGTARGLLVQNGQPTHGCHF